MERNKFIAAIFAATVIPIASFSFNPKRFDRIDKGFKIKAGEGRKHDHIQLKGVNMNILDVKVSGTDTDGNLAIFEQTGLSQGKGTPMHIHYFQDEIFYVLEGEYYFQVGVDKYNLNVGDSIFLPRNVPHAWTQITEKGKMTVVLQPAGKLEEFFVAMAALESEPTNDEIAKVFADHDMLVVVPPLIIE
jgi:quercetin dioxygenase-like cupin family protein